MLVKFSGHNFSSFLLCPGGPVRLRGKEGAGERSPREPRTGRPGAPAVSGGTHHVARHRQCRRAMERPEDMAMAGSLAETIFACHTSRLGTLNALSGAGKGTRALAGAGSDGGGSPRRPYVRGRPGCQAPGMGAGEASFPAPLTLSGQQAPIPAALPLPPPPRPARGPALRPALPSRLPRGRERPPPHPPPGGCRSVKPACPVPARGCGEVREGRLGRLC